MRPIGETIRAYRAERGLTLAQLGEAVGIPGSQVWRHEESDAVEAKRLLKFASALRVPLSDFLGEEVVALEREAGKSAGLTAEESSWLDRRRLLTAEERAAEDQLLQLDDEGRRLVAAYLSLPADGRRRLVKEARKIAIDFEPEPAASGDNVGGR